MITALALLSLTSPGVLDVEIASPANGAVVSGTVQISGTSSGVGPGVVSISIDNGPFVPATGTDSWTFAWNTIGLTDGTHNVRARAREFIGGPQVFDVIQVDVMNGAVLTVSIDDPDSGDVIIDTLVVTGSSQNATSVSLSVDGGPFEAANGVDPWTVVFEPGALAIGQHLLSARASDGVNTVFDSISITIADPAPGQQEFTYFSSVDGVSMKSKLWIPAGFDPLGPDTALVVHLHGGGGLGNINPTMQSELDARGWIGIAPDGRDWGLADIGCTWNTSAAYVDNPDPNVGAGEQDIFDAIQWALDNLPIDTDRIYLTGGSMGGRGTYAIGLKNPDFFAAIAPNDPAIDMYEIFARRPEPCVCKEGMVGGKPGDSPFVDTMYSITSGRFLIENAFNVPVFHGHGTMDDVANNNPANGIYLHGFHITNDASWNGDHVSASTLNGFGNSCLTDASVLPYVLGFGHTPTLAELAANEPGGYDWGFMFTPVGHQQDPRWATGTPLAPGITGVPDPNVPGSLLGFYDFFEARTLEHSPEKVVYKTYTDTHREAFWTAIDITTPWLDLPGAIRATRDIAQNRLDVELVRVAACTIDVDRAQLLAYMPLTVELAELDEATYDPNLVATGEVLSPTVVLQSGAFGGPVTVLRDGVPLDPALVVVSPGEVAIGPLLVSSPTTLTIDPLTGFAETCNGDGGDGLGCTDCPCANEAAPGTIGGCLNSSGSALRLIGTGTGAIATANLRFEAVGAPPLNSAILTSGTALAPANAANPCFGLDSGIQSFALDGLRCAVQGVLRHGVRPSDFAGDIGVTTNGWGTPDGFFNFAAFTSGTTRHFQIVSRDDAAAVCMTGQTTSQAVSVMFLP